MFRSQFRRLIQNSVTTVRQTARLSSVRFVTFNKNGFYFTGGVAVVLATALLLKNTADASAPVVDYKKVKADIIAAIEAEDSRRSDGTSIGPTLVRLAWHAAGTYSIHDKTGGSNGASMRYSPESDWGANKGLKGARDLLEAIRQKHPGLTTADLWTLAGATAIEAMGGPVVPWRSGRTDAPPNDTKKTLPDGRLPNANMGNPAATNSHIRDIFGRMGFNDREIVALIGAHALGRCHVEASGFWGPWT
ncbi:hypothetical protein EON65_43130, partial [archaeon]